MGPNYTNPTVPWSNQWQYRLEALTKQVASFERMAEVDADLRVAPRYLHYKMDGHQARITHIGCHAPASPGDVSPWLKIESRIGTDLTRDLAWHPSVMAFAKTAPMGASIWCEVYVPGRDSSAVKTAIIARDPALRVDCFMVERVRSCVGLHSWLEYHTAGHEDRGWSIFTMPLECVQHVVESWGVPFLPFVRADKYTKYVAEHGIGALCKYIATAQRIEGVVLKDGNCTGMLKWKPRHTLDAVVTGWERGKSEGRHAHRLGALLVSVYDTRNPSGEVGAELCEIAKVSGMTDADRDEMTRNPIVGRVCEVEYTGLGSQCRLRHPRFVRWREDKRAEDCTMEQLSHLEAPF